MENLPSQFVEIKKKGVHIKTQGNLRDAEWVEVAKAFLLFSFLIPLAFSTLISLLIFIVQGRPISTLNFIIIALIIGIVSTASTIYWGWKKKFEAWYFFDHENKILYVLTINRNPTLFEIPFEEIEEIQWIGGKNGYARIVSPAGSLITERASRKREGSITELWTDLAMTEAPFVDWPIKLWCPSCKKYFAHHIGTAVCPFEPEIALIDPEIKGRHDPAGMSEEDLDRI